MHNNLDIELIDFIDLLNDTLSLKFVERWRFRYSEKFLKHFQLKLLDSLANQKPIKIDTLFNFLTKKCNYSSEQVINFFDAIDIDMYRPMIKGKFTKRGSSSS